MTAPSYAQGFVPDEVNAPLRWERTIFGRPQVTMNWHHVIPRSLLRNAWNALARHQTTSDKAQLALHTYLRLVGFEHADAKRLLAAMGAGALAWEDQERVEVAVSYPVWDIVEGPENRSDDPDNHFDEYSVGLSPGELNRQSKLLHLYGGLRRFNEATAGEGLVEPRKFTALATDMFLVERTLDGVKTLIPFRESMWEMTPTPGGKAVTPAKWRKKRRVRAGVQTG
jgi:hypothetical protein